MSTIHLVVRKSFHYDDESYSEESGDGDVLAAYEDKAQAQEEARRRNIKELLEFDTSPFEPLRHNMADWEDLVAAPRNEWTDWLQEELGVEPPDFSGLEEYPESLFDTLSDWWQETVTEEEAVVQYKIAATLAYQIVHVVETELHPSPRPPEEGS